MMLLCKEEFYIVAHLESHRYKLSIESCS